MSAAAAALDFDGDYGRQYAATIRRSIPGYDALLEIAAAAAAASVPQASRALVVGPGLGEELPGLLAALPAAGFVLLEPSEQMRRSCLAVIEGQGAQGRCQLLEQSLGQADVLRGQSFEVVVCHHVLHLLPPEEQRRALRQLAGWVAPGGCLLLSSYGEPTDALELEQVLAISRSRLLLLGMDADGVERLLATRNRVVFALDASLLAEELSATGLEPPRPLLQALGSRLWLSRRSESAAAPSS